jgi:hypothetical protein
MDLRNLYSWEIETVDGIITKQYSESGEEQSWKSLDTEKIVRCSFLPAVGILPRHDVLIDLVEGERFIKRFGRGFLKQRESGIELREYLNCCVTNNYRFWVFASSGRTLVTRKDYEVYI